MLILLLALAGSAPDMDAARLAAWVERLQSFESRVAGTPGAFAAADAVEAELRGLGLEVERRPFAVRNAYDGGRPVLTENLSVGIGAASLPRIVVIAHLDARGAADPADAARRGWRWDRSPAPGADDDASGCAVLLELARLLRGRDFERRIDLVFTGAEEMAEVAADGFMENLGAERAADDYAENDVRIEGVIAIDMLLRARPWGSALRVYSDGGVSSELAQVILQAGWAAQAPMMVEVRNDPSFTWSDHGSFWAYGVPAVLVIEDDFHHPRYHTEQDRLGDEEFYSVEQMVSAGRVLLEAITTLARPRTAPASPPAGSPPPAARSDAAR